MITEELLHKTLSERFGFQTFRPFQLQAIQTLFAQGKLLCIFPTGHGKSLLYQLPACLMENMTIVISPLLALMRDQITQLNHRFNIPSASLNSDQSDEENEEARQRAANRQLKILFIAPEQLDHVDKFKFLDELPIDLIVIDEAHCISTWGHDFRPSYRQISKFIQAKTGAKILALTATANQKTEKDIEKQLSSQNQPVAILRESLDRKNLHLSVAKVDGISQKLAVIEQLLKSLEGSGLIYCATRENVEIVAEYLQSKGWNAAGYHAGYLAEEKRALQEAFIQDKFKVLAATNALGMGIDKPNIRFIIHFDFPGSITAYYQEVGRAGRDGMRAEGILLYDSKDFIIQNYFIQSALPKDEDFRSIMSALNQEPLGMVAIKNKTGLHPTRVTVALAELVEQGAIEKFAEKGKQLYREKNSSITIDLSHYERLLEAKKSELALMTRYCTERQECLMSLLREALGCRDILPCTRCAVCTGKIPVFENLHLTPILTWLQNRPVPIAKTRNTNEGISLLDGTLKLPAFIKFMKGRREEQEIDLELWELLCEKLHRFRDCKSLIALPSNTWKGRDAFGEKIAHLLKIPFFPNALVWKSPLEKRQGELLNNDQRRANVQEQMTFNAHIAIPEGPILLLDDYTGSGATLNEAARAIRQEGFLKNPIYPLTIAAVKWHLGKPGMV